MKDGIYFVVFKSAQNDAGTGTVVVRNNTVNGGDFGFTYQGVIQANNLDLLVFQHDPQAQCVIPGLHEYRATFAIQQSASGYLLQGSIPGIPNANLEVHAKFIGDLV
ncbi:GrlR family regulatory protein [Pectobacterium brasiliense]|uniref:GrlR family regulatory protein n=1 Tax=Pectobacterium brasiliense TaxID=180957 RepID=UPI0019698A81|nr:GrlR family regulatory protein [Pectobacterium brasiliense]MBN3122841.1 negative regulator GrlR [Pectobacterium brasiliense]MBN3145085.1 negative regulator GrlR [Pectobacterium brasiliense]QSD21245.1 negative regulator GrlR [Pectobacterium brasiliense]